MQIKKYQLSLDDIITNYIHKKISPQKTINSGNMSPVIIPSKTTSTYQAHIKKLKSQYLANNLKKQKIQHIFSLAEWLENKESSSRLFAYRHMERGSLSGRRNHSKIISIDDGDPEIEIANQTANNWRNIKIGSQTMRNFRQENEGRSLRKSERKREANHIRLKVNDSHLVLGAGSKDRKRPLRLTNKHFYHTLYH